MDLKDKLSNYTALTTVALGAIMMYLEGSAAFSIKDLIQFIVIAILGYLTGKPANLKK